MATPPTDTMGKCPVHQIACAAGGRCPVCGAAPVAAPSTGGLGRAGLPGDTEAPQVRTVTALTTAPSAAHDDQGKPSSGFKMPAGFIFGLGAVLYVSSLCSYLGLRFLVNGTILTALWTGGRLLKSTSRLSAGSWLVATVLVIAGAVASYLGYPPLGLLAQILWP